jgi:uncharacterized membrane protein YeaQ/YmgE (transglycosylase-associated protein family)
VLFFLLVVAVVLFVVLPFIGATVFSVLQALVVGLLLGLVARAIAPGSGKLSLSKTALAGVVGGLVGRIAARALHTHRIGELLLELAAAALLVVVLRSSRGIAA